MIRKFLLWLLELNSSKVYGYTGHTCKISGIYRSDDEYIPLSKNETFPPTSNQGVMWTLVVNL